MFPVLNGVSALLIVLMALGVVGLSTLPFIWCLCVTIKVVGIEGFIMFVCYALVGMFALALVWEALSFII